MAVSKRTRYEVLRRDNYTCRYCGTSVADGAVLTVDHVVPTTLGGSDDPTNLVAACRDCNAGKASTSPDAELVADVAQDALRWAAAIKLAAHNAEARGSEERAYKAAFFDDLRSYFPDKPEAWKRLLPDDWELSIITFYRRGLPAATLSRALETTMTRARARMVSEAGFFRYLCGICWKTLKEIEDEAARLVRVGEL
jgi:hypothetical protein